MRAALYARFSTELQSERSIADQLEICRAHAERQGLLGLGLCGNPASHRAGLLTFEHQGCPEFERE